jgi:hypothetical protein
LLCGRPLDDYLVWLDVQQISAKPLQLIGDFNLSSQAAAPAAKAGSAGSLGRRGWQGSTAAERRQAENSKRLASFLLTPLVKLRRERNHV